MKYTLYLCSKIILSIFYLTAFSCICVAGDLSAEKIYKKVSKSMAIIYSVDANGQRKGQGSGVIISVDGKIVTNFHVIGNASKIEVMLNGSTLPAKLIGFDADHDLAVLKISLNNCVPINRVKHTVSIGEKIYAIGSPLGYENTISEGIISGRRHTSLTTANLLQITAPLSPGSSGGAIVNTKGILIGISAIAFQGSAQNINFAIPAELIDSVQLKDEILPYELIIAANLREVRSLNRHADSFKIIRLLKEVLQYDPRNEEATAQLCYTYFDIKESELAKDYCRKLISINPENPTAYFVRGLISFNNGNYLQATDDARQMVAIDKSIGAGHCLLGRCTYMLNEPVEAEVELKEALDLDSTDNDAWYFMACLYCDKIKFDDALQYAQKAFDYNDKYFECNLLVGKIFSRYNQEEQARDFYQDAIKINRRSSLAHLLLAESCLKSQLYEKAKQEADKAISYDSTECLAYELLLIADLSRMLADESVDDYRHLYECDPSKAFAYSAFMDTNGIKTANEISFEQLIEIPAFPILDHAFIQKINEEELKTKNQIQIAKSKFSKRAPYTNKNKLPAPRSFAPVDTLQIGGSYYMECENLITFRGQAIISMKRWGQDKEPALTAILFDNRGKKLAKIEDGKLINLHGNEIKIRSSAKEFVCYNSTTDETLIKFTRTNTKGYSLILVSLNMVLPDGSLLVCTPETSDPRMNIFGERNYFSGGGCIEIN